MDTNSPIELCNLELPPLEDIEPIQHYRVISTNPIYDTLGNLQALNSTVTKGSFGNERQKKFNQLMKLGKREYMAPHSHIKLVIDTRDLLQLYCLWLLMVLKPI